MHEYQFDVCLFAPSEDGASGKRLNIVVSSMADIFVVYLEQHDFRYMKNSYRTYKEQRLKKVTGIYNLFKSKILRANIELIPHKAIIRSIVACATCVWKFVTSQCVF
jgi:hypothetical protein